ncbi:phosphatase PAP2 family protein [Alloscardovia omnicolens]|uniref:phosphatase PAP2 family protein n=1 Tax=Alloscardovia omnicolens TaxID=419015 RepID=UPI003A6D6DE1
MVDEQNVSEVVEIANADNTRNEQTSQTDGQSPDALSEPVSEKEDNTAPRVIDRGSDDYLATHPRVSSVVLSVVCALLGLAAAAGVFYAGVWTLSGQRFDSWMWSDMSQLFPSIRSIVPPLFTDSMWIIAASVVMIAFALLIAVLRKRFYTFTLTVIFIALAFASSYTLKRVLPRPVLDSYIPDPANSAPSGHTALAMIACVSLVLCAPRVLRAVCALWGVLFSTSVGVMVIYDNWHRPTDSMMSILLVASLGILAMAFTRASGMDKLGTRKSSISIQIMSTVLIVLGALAVAYGVYVVSQIYPVVQYRPESVSLYGAYATLALIGGSSSFMFGLLLALRQLTASPLTRFGLLGGPPAPPHL